MTQTDLVESIISRYAVKVNIPPAGKNEVIIITGEKNGVEKAADEIRQIYESKVVFLLCEREVSRIGAQKEKLFCFLDLASGIF